MVAGSRVYHQRRHSGFPGDTWPDQPRVPAFFRWNGKGLSQEPQQTTILIFHNFIWRHGEGLSRAPYYDYFQYFGLYLMALQSPLPFPLLKGWTRAWYYPLFRGEFKEKWSRAPVFVVRGRALHLVAAFHLYSTWKSEMHFVLIYLGMRWVIQENPIALFCQSCSARAHNQTSKCGKEPRSINRRLYF